GLMHACGHDMHTAGLLGALVLLEQNRQRWHGTVWGLFQPAEEMHPGGASVVIGEGTFKGVEPRFFLGAHCSPELETGVIGLCQGQFMASTDEIHMTIHGAGGHGAMPHQLQDTVLAQAAVVMALQQVVSRRCNAFIPTVLSFGKVVAAGATNIIPSEVYMEGTFRTMDEQWRAQAKEVITQVACSTALAYGCTAQVDIRDGYPSVINDPSLTQQAMAVAEKLFGKTGVQIIPKRMTAEDFGFYAARYKALFFRLGTGGGAPLHNAAFCPNEQALAYGAAMMAAFVMAQE
ncbi:MAG: M20 family metallopeptidase, partial [Mucinivorans sp.]